MITRQDDSAGKSLLNIQEMLQALSYTKILKNKNVAEAAEFNVLFFSKLKALREEGTLILLMTAGPGDSWFRDKFKK